MEMNIVKKIILVTIMGLLLAIASTNISQAVHADARSDAMGFAIDSETYGVNMDYIYTTAYARFNSKIIGFIKYQTAVYEDQADDEFNLVIMHTTSEPKESVYKCGLFNLFTCTYDGAVDSVDVHSDIDSGYYPVYSGVYYSSTGFIMHNPKPEPVADVTEYTLSYVYGANPTVSASVTINVSELEIFTQHSSSNQYFEVNYQYYCVESCTYIFDETYNKAMFMVEKQDYFGNIGSFVNISYMEATFYAYGYMTPVNVWVRNDIYY